MSTVQEFESVCGILAAILNIGDIRLETDFIAQSHLGEVSSISNRSLLDDGEPGHLPNTHGGLPGTPCSLYSLPAASSGFGPIRAVPGDVPGGDSR